MKPQEQILQMLKARKIVTSREFVRECQTWDHRKIICRLRAQGHNIVNVNKTGIEAKYVYLDGGQMELKVGG